MRNITVPKIFTIGDNSSIFPNINSIIISGQETLDTMSNKFNNQVQIHFFIHFFIRIFVELKTKE